MVAFPTETPALVLRGNPIATPHPKRFGGSAFDCFQLATTQLHQHIFTMKILSLATLLLLLGADAFAPSLLHNQRLLTFRLEARRPFISGNWKLNPQTKEEAVQLASAIAQSITSSSPDAEVALFVPYVFIESAMHAVNGKLQVGAEVSKSSRDLAVNRRLTVFFCRPFYV
jgi:Triosephosphate isomerase